jgi:hypothetical protein
MTAWMLAFDAIRAPGPRARPESVQPAEFLEDYPGSFFFFSRGSTVCSVTIRVAFLLASFALGFVAVGAALAAPPTEPPDTAELPELPPEGGSATLCVNGLTSVFCSFDGLRKTCHFDEGACRASGWCIWR